MEPAQDYLNKILPILSDHLVVILALVVSILALTMTIRSLNKNEFLKITFKFTLHSGKPIKK